MNPLKLHVAEEAQTAADGSFNFTRIGADRFFLLTHCQIRDAAKQIVNSWWQPVFYPAAISMKEAQEILLRPGEHRTGFDFHLARAKTYRLEANPVSGDGSTVDPFSGQLEVLRADRSLTSTPLGQEDCALNYETGRILCPTLSPGKYTLYMQALEQRWTETLASAKVDFTVVKDNQHLTIQLHRMPEHVPNRLLTNGSHGELDLNRACQMSVDQTPEIDVIAWGRLSSAGFCNAVLFQPKLLPMRLPPDTYTVNAIERSFDLGDSRP